MQSIQLCQNNMLDKFIEVNLLGPTKICSFDCGYCSLGKTSAKLKNLNESSFIPFEDILFELKDVISKNADYTKIVISGNGEPTLFPHFFEFSKELSDLITSRNSEHQTVLLTNGAHLDSKKILEACAFYSDVIIKLDVGTQEHFKEFNAPLVRGGIERIITNARKIKNPSIQTQVAKINGVIFLKEKFDDYCELVGMISPRAIYLQSMSLPANNDAFKKVSDDEIEIIASLLRRRFTFDVKVS